MQIQGVLFDWGGTLASVDRQRESLTRGASQALDSLLGGAAADLVDSLVSAAIEAELRASADPEHREVQLHAFIGSWAAEHGLGLSDDQVATALDMIGQSWVGSALTPFAGAREALMTLRAMGLRIGLVSNCFIPPRHCHDELRLEGLSELLDCAVFSSGVGFRKPSRRIYAEAVHLLAEAGGPESYANILFVGDSPAYDVMMPAALGMHTALVTCHRGLWAPEDYEKARPDFRIDSVGELPVLLADLS